MLLDGKHIPPKDNVAAPGSGRSSGTACPTVWVDPPTTAALPSESNEIVVPPTVIWLPGVRVWPLITTCVAEFAVKVESPTVMNGISGVSGVPDECHVGIPIVKVHGNESYPPRQIRCHHHCRYQDCLHSGQDR